MTAYEHGQVAASHSKHIQACPFDTGTQQWKEWRAGYLYTPRPVPRPAYPSEMIRAPRYDGRSTDYLLNI